MWRILQVQGLVAHSTTQLKVGLRYCSLSDKFEDIVEVTEVLFLVAGLVLLSEAVNMSLGCLR